MKKDKGWLLTELRTIDSTINNNEFVFGYETAIDLAVELVNQLDETQLTNHFDEENFRQWAAINLWGARVVKSSMRTTWVEGKELEDFLVNAVKGNLGDSEITEAQAWETLAPRFSMSASELERQVLDDFIAMTAEEIELESDKIKKLADGIKKLHAENEELKSKLEEPEKVVVPQFVADWIEIHRERESNIWHLMNNVDIKSDCNVELWTWLWSDNNAVLIARAWLDGYEVEEEQKYRVEDDNHTLLCKWESSDGWKVISTIEATDDDLPIEILDFELTEKEIKGYDPRYWAFAVPVEVAE